MRNTAKGRQSATAGNRSVQAQYADAGLDVVDVRQPQLEIKGKVAWTLRDPSGRVKEWGSGENLITTVGKDNIAEIVRANSGTPATISHVGFGTGGAAVAESQTALQGTEQLARAAFASKVRTGNEVAFSVTGVLNSSGSPRTINEMGIFNAAAAGVMFARFLTQGFTMADGDAIDVTWTLSFGS